MKTTRRNNSPSSMSLSECSPRYLPCPHQHFRAPLVDRSQLDPKDHLALLATPRGYRWSGGFPPNYSGPKPFSLLMPTRKKNQDDQKMLDEAEERYMHQFVSQIFPLLSTEMVNRLKRMLIVEFGMTPKKAGEFIKSQKSAQKNKPKRKLNECNEMDINVKTLWLKEFERLLKDKITDYLVSHMCAKRSKKVETIAESVLNHLSDITGEWCTLDNPQNQVQRDQVFLAEKFAVWIANQLDKADKKVCEENDEWPDGGTGEKKKPSVVSKTESTHKPKPGKGKKLKQEEKLGAKKGKEKKVEEKKVEEKKVEEKKVEEKKEEGQIEDEQKKQQMEGEQVEKKQEEVEEKEDKQKEEEQLKEEEEQMKKKQEEEERKKLEQEEEEQKKLEQEEEEKKKEEQKKKEEEQKKLEEERKKREEEQKKLEQEEEERKKKEEEQKKLEEEEEKRKKKEEEQKKKEEEQEKLKQEEEERKKKEEEQKKKEEEQKKLEEEEEERKKKEEEQKLNLEDEEQHPTDTEEEEEVGVDESAAGDVGGKEALEVVEEWIKETEPSETDRQKGISKIIEGEVKKSMGDDIKPEDEEAISIISKKTSTFVDKAASDALKTIDGQDRIPMQPVKARVAYSVKKNKEGCYYEVKNIDKKEVCDRTKIARKKRVAMVSTAVCERPKTLKPIKTSTDMKKWSKWATGVVNFVEKWSNWIDNARKEVDAHSEDQKTKADADNKKLKEKTEIGALEMKRNKKYIKESSKDWKTKLNSEIST